MLEQKSWLNNLESETPKFVTPHLKEKSIPEDIFQKDSKKLTQKTKEIRNSIFSSLNLSENQKEEWLSWLCQWLITSIILDNYELLQQISSLDFVKILNRLKNMELDDIQTIVTSVFTWIWDLAKWFVSWNFYEFWKSVWAIWWPVLWAFLWKIALKAWIKWIKEIKIKPNENKTMIHNKAKDDLWDLKKSLWEKNKWTLEIVDDSLVWLTVKEFNSKLLNILEKNPEIKEVDLSKLKDPDTKRKIYEIVWKNHPLLEVSRLIEWQKIVDINFMWIKYLNDFVSKEFCDLFIWELKKHISKNFDKILLWEDAGRIVRTDYKHMTFSMRDDLDVWAKLFAWEQDKSKLFSKAFDSIEEKELQKILSQTKIKSKEELKKIVLEKFNIWIWSSKITWKTIDEKLVSFYEAEISSKNISDLSKLWENIAYNFDDIKKISKNILEIEKNLVSKYSWQKIEIFWVKYDIIVDDSINPILLREVRKWQEISNKVLNQELKKYIDSLNSWFDFISPYIKREDIWKIADLDRQISELKISRERIEKNYKWTYTKEALEKNIEWKQWISVFVDIVDMGLMNLKDFKVLASKVESWIITKENIWELLTAGNTATSKFQSLVNQIVIDYPKAKISLWWDELFVFIPWISKRETSIIIQDISKSLQRNNLKWRISHNFETKIGNFDYLDSITKVNKIFEKDLEKVFYSKEFEKIDKLIFNSINVEISWEIEKKFLKNSQIIYAKLNNPKENFFEILEKIDKTNLSKILTWEEKEIFIKWDWVNLLIKNKNSNLEINIL